MALAASPPRFALPGVIRLRLIPPGPLGVYSGTLVLLLAPCPIERMYVGQPHLVGVVSMEQHYEIKYMAAPLCGSTAEAPLCDFAQPTCLLVCAADE